LVAKGEYPRPEKKEEEEGQLKKKKTTKFGKIETINFSTNFVRK
jgi:hypothetical protein